MLKVQHGFTLIELIIVIVIIGIFTTVVVPRYANRTKRAEISEVRNAVSIIRSAIEDCYLRNAGNILCNGITPPATGILDGQVSQAMLDLVATTPHVDAVILNDCAVPVITVAPAAAEGFAITDTYIVTGSVNGTAGINATIGDWTEGGVACLMQGWC